LLSEMEQEVVSAQAGDREAFIRLLQGVESTLYSIARSMLRQDEDCADAIQETMLKAYKAIYGLKKPAYFKTWICRILINQCNEILRQRARTQTIADIHVLSSDVKEYEKIDLRDAVDQLDESLRIVVVLHYLQDIPIKDVAHILDISVNAVKNRLYRARNILLESLDQSRERKLNYGSV
jgi:RNA polymerase sigma factor (sigma-70 family)